jgi:hypothetical protein
MPEVIGVFIILLVQFWVLLLLLTDFFQGIIDLSQRRKPHQAGIFLGLSLRSKRLCEVIACGREKS